jgi:GrpB-like predicted nucleotidyltransferase (UPF0157 family)
MSDQPSKSGSQGAGSVIGPPEVLNGPIVLVEYRAEWPSQFERESSRIRAALADRALEVEHVGSTSVPGLAAKPRIDILLVVANSGDESSYVPDLEAAGYVLRIREPHWHEHRVFKGPDVAVNLHTFSADCREIERMVRFRERLRSDADDRGHYEQTKRSLAGRTWKVTQDYADAKADVVDTILSRIGVQPLGDHPCPGPA